MDSQNTHSLIVMELERRSKTLTLIPSENHPSPAVRAATGSALSDKYSEGYPGRRYYQGNVIIDHIERHAIALAKEVFGVPYANVQPYSGSPANSAIYFGLLQQGDPVMGLKLSGGGHLTHGHPDITFSGSFYTSEQYDVDADGHIDMGNVRKLTLSHKPKLITVGTTAYPRNFDWAAWRDVADEIGALLHADISHVAGLVAGKAIPSPVPHVDVVMTTTHKSLRGPRGAMILVTERGLARDPDMGNKIDRAVFPGLQGGPHNNTTAAIAVALEEAQEPAFADYAQRIVTNASVLADGLMAQGLTLVTGGTDNHLIVVDLRQQELSGNVVAEALEVAGIITNRNSVPHDPMPPFYPSGLRIGTPAATTRGMDESHMKRIAEWIGDVVAIVKNEKLPQNKDDRISFMKNFRQRIASNEKLGAIRTDVEKLCSEFPAL